MSRFASTNTAQHTRLRVAAALWLVLAGLFITRLFYIQVVEHTKFDDAAKLTRQINTTIRAKRGEIFISGARFNQNTTTPLALNRDQLILISDNRKIVNPAVFADVIATSTNATAEDREMLLQKLSDRTRAYQPLIKDISVEVLEEIQIKMNELELVGLFVDRIPARLYPEKDLFAQTIGFLGRDEKAQPIGRYGVEGFFNKRLSGIDGFVKTERDPFGSWIPVADREFQSARDGDDLILTFDRAIQLKLCEALQKGVAAYNAKSASGAVMNPKTGEVWAMCNVPAFDPNEYQKAEGYTYNNNFIFQAFESGSVFKAITVSAALDAGAITPDTLFVDTGSINRDGFIIHNAANKSWGMQTMTGVIKESINTGTVFAAEKLGRDKFAFYVKNFGFGVLTGIELKVEEDGNIKSINKKCASCLANNSFGQGLTVTPLQLLQAYGAIANAGVMMRPTVVRAWRAPDGVTEWNEPKEIRRVISKKAADEITEMLRVAVEEGHGKKARVPSYSLAGKTGTGQIAGPNGKYLEAAFNHTFAGFAPISNPRFVMVIKFEKPQALYAESTAVPTFGAVAKFILEYLGVPPDRTVDKK